MIIPLRTLCHTANALQWGYSVLSEAPGRVRNCVQKLGPGQHNTYSMFLNLAWSIERNQTKTQY